MEFINPWMLLGLGGLSLPVIAHLLNRKRFSVVDWGAMQFLDLGRRSRRRMRLEELLLLLIRMLMLALLTLAVARPWVEGGWLSRVASGQSRDVVLVVDGSYSMQRRESDAILHDQARDVAARFLAELRPGDTAALLDVRDHVRPVVTPPTRDLQVVRNEIDALPAASSSANFPEAIARGIKLLQGTTNVAREIIVLTDGQEHGWQVDDALAWSRVDEMAQLSSVTPRTWVFNVGSQEKSPRPNFSLDQIRIQREQTVRGFPIRLESKVVATGTTAPQLRTVSLEVDGEPQEGTSRTIRLEPGGETPVEFEWVLEEPGPHVLAIVLQEDDLPADNRSELAVHVGPGVPVLVVDGDPQLDPVKSESFFMEVACGRTGDPNAWVAATVVPWTQIPIDELDKYRAIVLANVPRLTDAELAAVSDAVQRGQGLLVASGDRIDRGWYEKRLFADGRSLLPARPLEISEAAGDLELSGMQLSPAQFSALWLERFREDGDSELARARFSKWWRVTVPAGIASASRRETMTTDDRDRARTGSAIVAARFENNAPFIVTREYGRGRVALLTAPLDADWSTLPARRSFVPFVHELLFYLAANGARLNVAVGDPLVFPAEEHISQDGVEFVGPADQSFDADVLGDEDQAVFQLNQTQLPGGYRLRQTTGPGPVLARFVVREDRTESDLTPLADTQIDALSENGRLTFVTDLDDLRKQMFSGENRAELWHLCLWLFVVLLLAEIMMTRRMLRGSHAPEQEQEPDDQDDAYSADEFVRTPVSAEAALEEIVREKRRGGWSSGRDL